MAELQLRASVCEVCRSLWNRGLVGAVEGNVSVRLDTKSLLCTPAGKHKGTLKPDDICVVDYDGKLKKGERATSELQIHLEIYAQRPDCQAVVHAHPPTATAFALVHETLPDNLVPEAAVFLGPVGLVPFALPGTPETREVLRPFLEEHKTLLLSNHGAVTLGTDLFDAFARMETLERVMHVYLLSRLLGQPRAMPKDAFNILLSTALSGRLG